MARVTRVISVNKPVVRVRYDVGDKTAQELETVVNTFLKKHSLA